MTMRIARPTVRARIGGGIFFTQLFDTMADNLYGESNPFQKEADMGGGEAKVGDVVRVVADYECRASLSAEPQRVERDFEMTMGQMPDDPDERRAGMADQFIRAAQRRPSPEGCMWRRLVGVRPYRLGVYPRHEVDPTPHASLSRFFTEAKALAAFLAGL